MSAVALDPSRAEAHLALGDIFFAEQKWTQAAPFFAAATCAVRPVAGFIADMDYTWRAWDFLGVCLINSGRHQDGIEATMRALELGSPDRGRLTANLHWAIDALAAVKSGTT
jgi:hypothetical protein